MKAQIIVFNFVTAFTISAGTALGVVLIGGQPTKWQVIGAVIAGLVVASKDTRSLVKLPPVEAESNSSPKPPVL